MNEMTVTMSSDKVEDFETLLNDLFDTKQVVIKTTACYEREDKCRVYTLVGSARDFWLLGVYWGIKLAHKMQGDTKYSIGDLHNGQQ